MTTFLVAFIWGLGVSVGVSVGALTFFAGFWGLEKLFGRDNIESAEKLFFRNNIKERNESLALIAEHLQTIAISRGEQ